MPKTTTHALMHREFGNPEEVLQLEEVELPALAGGQIAVRLLASPIHPSDLGMIGGSYGRLRDLPARAGREAVGEVVEAGPGVDGAWVGRRVRLPEDEGVWQERLHVGVDAVVPVPDDVDPVQAALVAVNSTTALRLLTDFVDLQPGDWIVQNAGNSSVGIAVSQIARAKGFHTASLVRREELFEPLRERGADLVLLEDREAPAKIRDAAKGASVRLGLNSIGGTSVLSVIQSVDDGSPVVTFGAMTGDKIRFPTRQLIFNDIRLRGFWMDRWNRSHTSGEKQAMFDEVYDWVRSGVLHTPVEKTFPLSDFREALEAQKGGRLGKVLFSAS